MTREELASSLEQKLNRIPAPVLNGSHNLAVKYKQWAVAALKQLKRGSVEKLKQLHHDYNGFCKEQTK